MTKLGLKHLLPSLLMLCLVGFSYSVSAALGDSEVLNARAAYDKKNEFALVDAIHRLKSQQHVLTPYAEYWLMLMTLDRRSHDDVQAFLNQYHTLPFTGRLRGDWLKRLGKQQDWPHFLEMYPQYTLQDPAISCYAAQANVASGDHAALESAKVLWEQIKEHPSECKLLFDQLQAAKLLTEEDILQRFRMALSDNKIASARSVVGRSSQWSAALNKQLDLAYANPSNALNRKQINLKVRYGRELALYALTRLAKSQSAQALQLFKQMSGQFNQEETSYFYGQLAFYAAQRHEPNSIAWFKQASYTTLNPEQLEWYARAALRQTDWKLLLDVVNTMTSEQSEEATWRYWKARALKAQHQTFEAESLFTGLANERHFYGWLAQEELGPTVSAPSIPYIPTNDEVSIFEKQEAIQRAEALLRLDYKWEAKLEWALATEQLDDQQLLVAAEYAMRKKWFDLAVATADKTRDLHNFALRYPTPYREFMKPAALTQGVDEAWVYGIIRQESRFMHYAKSSVGAAGLMQVMPATAKWIAGKMGLREYQHSMLHDLDTNITLGTYYMRYTVNQFNGQETMATAAYNAGPSRAKRWMADVPLEGAIYAETIPFSETRNYVKKVMANAHLYAPQLGLTPIPLTKRLGVIPARVDPLSSNLSQLNE